MGVKAGGSQRKRSENLEGRVRVPVTFLDFGMSIVQIFEHCCFLAVWAVLYIFGMLLFFSVLRI